MRGFVLTVVVAFSMLLTACGSAEEGAEEVAAPLEVDPTAAYQSARATIVAQRRGDTTAVARATATATAPTTPTVPAVTPTATAELAQMIDIMQFFPTDEQLPGEFMMTYDHAVSAEEIASGYSDPATQLQRLEEWGFQQLHSRRYELPDSLLVDDRMNVVIVSVYQYGSREQAQAAAEWNLEWVYTCGCWTDFIDPAYTPVWDAVFGTTGRAIQEPSYNIAWAYLINGSILVRVEGLATSTDPVPEVDAFIQSLYGQQADVRHVRQSPEG